MENVKNSEILDSEARIQQDCVRWYNNSYCLEHHTSRCLILAIPNENQPMLVAIGLYAGAADLLVIWRGTATETPRVAFIEMKDDKGTQKPKQKKFEAHVRSMGFQYAIVRSLEEFKALVETWK